MSTRIELASKRVYYSLFFRNISSRQIEGLQSFPRRLLPHIESKIFVSRYMQVITCNKVNPSDSEYVKSINCNMQHSRLSTQVHS